MIGRILLPLAFVAVLGAAVLALAARTGRTEHLEDAPAGKVHMQGARGDGIADDTAALQAAVEAGAGLVQLPRGTYRITKPILIDLDKVGFTSIEGHSVARVVMAGEGPAFRFVGTHGGTAAPATVQDNVWEKQRMPTITGIEIVGDHEKASGIEASGTMNLTLSRVLIRKCHHGIHLTSRNRNIIISDCHIYQNRGIGVFMDNVNLHQINITGSHVSYNDGGGIACVGGQVRNLQITGCDIEANHGKDLPPTANVLIESTGGTNAEVAITGNTIQHTRTVPGSANIRIKGPTTPSTGTDERRDGHITITGNILSDTNVNLHLDHARGVVIVGNTVWTGVEYNLLVENSTAVQVGVNNFDRNPRYFREEDGAADAVLFRNCSDCTVTGLQMQGVRKAEAGLVCENCRRFNIANLTVLDCDKAGVYWKNVSDSRLAGCLIRDDRQDAASVSIRTREGRNNLIVENSLGRPGDILNGVGLVERNYYTKP